MVSNVQNDIDRELRMSELREQLQNEMKRIQELEQKMQHIQQQNILANESWQLPYNQSIKVKIFVLPKSYEPKISAALGVATPDPWNARHAFTATALYVKDLGASAGGFTAERTAALKYYAGGNWSLPANAFYGDQVMNHAATFQQQIDFLKEVEN